MRTLSARCDASSTLMCFFDHGGLACAALHVTTTSHSPHPSVQAWETPVGLAVDRLSAAAAGGDPSVPLPFPVAVRSTGKPLALGGCGDERLRAHYMNTLKQASFLRFMSANPIMEMSQVGGDAGGGVGVGGGGCFLRRFLQTLIFDDELTSTMCGRQLGRRKHESHS
jgi:hypothetical protein